MYKFKIPLQDHCALFKVRSSHQLICKRCSSANNIKIKRRQFTPKDGLRRKIEEDIAWHLYNCRRIYMVSVDWTVRISLWFSIVCVFCQVSRMCSVCHREELYIEKKKKKLKKENWLQKKIKEISLKTVSRYRINVKSASKIQSEIELFEADLTNQQFFYGKWCLLFLVDEKFSDTEKKVSHFIYMYVMWVRQCSTWWKCECENETAPIPLYSGKRRNRIELCQHNIFHAYTRIGISYTWTDRQCWPFFLELEIEKEWHHFRSYNFACIWFLIIWMTL